MLTMTREEEQQHDAVRPQPQPLEDIVRRFTDDGRLIVGFLVSTMQGDIPDVTPTHQLQAARMLIKLGFSDAELPDDNSSKAPERTDTYEPGRRGNARRSKLDAELARFARDETDGGRDAIRFLVDVMQGNVPDFKPCHRLAAARELLRRGFDRHGGPGVQSEHEHEQDAEPQPEVPEGFRVATDGEIIPDWSRSDCAVVLDEKNMKQIGWGRFSDWLRRMKEKGHPILRPEWWREGLEEFVDEDAPTLIEAIQEAAEAQGITVAPHLLEATRLGNAPMSEAVPEEESWPEDLDDEEPWPEDLDDEEAEHELESDLEDEAAPEEEAEPESAVRDEDTNVPWSKPGYHYRDELSAHEKKVLEKGGTLHWYDVERRFP